MIGVVVATIVYILGNISFLAVLGHDGVVSSTAIASVSLSVCPSVCLSVCPSVRPSVCLYVCMNVYVSVYLCISLSASVAEWLRRLALKLLAPLRWGSLVVVSC